MSQVSSNSGNFFGVRVSQPGINVNQASPTQLILQDDYSTRLYYNSIGVPTVLLGLRSANGANLIGKNEQGLFISQSGIDVTQATDRQLAFNSSQSVLQEVVPKSTATIPGVAVAYNGVGIESVKVAHGLNYEPAMLAYANLPVLLSLGNTVNANVPMPYNSGTYYLYTGTGSAAANIELTPAVDSAYVYFTYYSQGTGSSGSTNVPAITVTYYLLTPSTI